MSVSLLVCYSQTEFRQIWGYLHFWMIFLSEFFKTILGHWFTSFYSAHEFLCAGLNFETCDLVTFWFSWGQLLRPLVLFMIQIHLKDFWKSSGLTFYPFSVTWDYLLGQFLAPNYYN